MKKMTTATVEYNWTYEQCSREAILELRVLSENKGVLLLFNEANIIGHYRVPVSGDMAKAVDLMENAESFPHSDLNDAFSGDGYGNDIRFTATFFGLKNEGVSCEEEPYLSEFKEYYSQRDQIVADLDWWDKAKAK